MQLSLATTVTAGKQQKELFQETLLGHSRKLETMAASYKDLLARVAAHGKKPEDH